MTTQHLFYLLIALQVADVASTLYAFRSGAYERNKVMRRIMAAIGTVPGLLLPKVIYGAVAWYYQQHLTVNAVIPIVVIYVAVIANNIRIARSLRA